MNEKLIEIARGNHAFYYVVVGMTMCSGDFTSAFIGCLLDDGHVLFPVEHSSFSGYIAIDTTDIRHNCSHGGMVDDVRNGLLGRIALKMPRGAMGEMNTGVTLVDGMYQLAFMITQYERDQAHSFELIKDPALSVDGERLGRYVELKVTFAHQ